MNAQTQEITPANQGLPVDPMVSMIERLAADPNSDLAKLEKMLDMKERLERQQAERAFAEAFSAMQASLSIVPERGKIINRSKEVQSTYPLWEDVNSMLREPLADNGLSMSFDRRREDGKVVYGCIVTHELGHSRRAEIDLPRDNSGSKNEVQGEGSSVSYGQRYSSKMLINWVSAGTEDDDGQSTVSQDRITAQQYRDLRDMIEKVGITEEVVCDAAGISMLPDLPADNFNSLKAKLKKTAEARGVEL